MNSTLAQVDDNPLRILGAGLVEAPNAPELRCRGRARRRAGNHSGGAHGLHAQHWVLAQSRLQRYSPVSQRALPKLALRAPLLGLGGCGAIVIEPPSALPRQA